LNQNTGLTVLSKSCVLFLSVENRSTGCQTIPRVVGSTTSVWASWPGSSADV